MKSTARKTRPKQTRGQTKRHDQRLFKRADAEDQEGRTEPNTARVGLSRELREMAERLQGATANIIEAYTGADIAFAHEAFAEALRVVNDVRTCLQCEADGLEKRGRVEVAA